MDMLEKTASFVKSLGYKGRGRSRYDHTQAVEFVMTEYRLPKVAAEQLVKRAEKRLDEGHSPRLWTG